MITAPRPHPATQVGKCRVTRLNRSNIPTTSTACEIAQAATIHPRTDLQARAAGPARIASIPRNWMAETAARAIMSGRYLAEKRDASTGTLHLIGSLMARVTGKMAGSDL